MMFPSYNAIEIVAFAILP